MPPANYQPSVLLLCARYAQLGVHDNALLPWLTSTVMIARQKEIKRRLPNPSETRQHLKALFGLVLCDVELCCHSKPLASAPSCIHIMPLPS